MTIGENIRRIRSKAGLTQEEFGKIAGVSGMAVSQWENGRAVPRMGAVERIASSLKIPKASIIDENVAYDSPRLPVSGMPMGKVPLVGHTHAGEPILPEEVDEYPEVSIPQFLIDRDPDSYGLAVDGDCMDVICPPGMVAVVQPNVAVRSGDVVVATIDGSDSIMRRATVINGDLILSPESHDKSHENVYVAANDERSVRLQHVSWFQSQDSF